VACHGDEGSGNIVKDFIFGYLAACCGEGSFNKERMIISVHQPQYIPWLGYFDKIAKSEAFVFLDTVQYKEREFQNRNKIRTPQGWIWLTVPVISKSQGRQNIFETKIDNQMPWQRKHDGSIKTSYSSARYFKEYFPFFEDVYTREWEYLKDLNIHIINFVLKELSISTPISLESALETAKTKTDRIIEICKKLKADTYLSGAGGKDYMDEALFDKEFIKLDYQHFNHPTYRQQYMKDEKDFLPYMSILDLLFNEGPESRKVLGLN
jgi:hypothetical protein